VQSVRFKTFSKKFGSTLVCRGTWVETSLPLDVLDEKNQLQKSALLISNQEE
jgi:hypothetical protein